MLCSTNNGTENGWVLVAHIKTDQNAKRSEHFTRRTKHFVRMISSTSAFCLLFLSLIIRRCGLVSFGKRIKFFPSLFTQEGGKKWEAELWMFAEKLFQCWLGRRLSCAIFNACPELCEEFSHRWLKVECKVHRAGNEMRMDCRCTREHSKAPHYNSRFATTKTSSKKVKIEAYGDVRLDCNFMFHNLHNYKVCFAIWQPHTVGCLYKEAPMWGKNKTSFNVIDKLLIACVMLVCMAFVCCCLLMLLFQPHFARKAQ